MAIEQVMERLIVALDSNTAAHKGAKSATTATAGTTVTTKTPKTTTAATGPTIDFDALKVAGAKVVAAHGKPFAKKLIKDIAGANELAGVKPDKYAPLMAAFETALKPAVEEPDEVEEEEEESL